eukprot:TRINITY_DN396_c0_g1_i1.p1 TRINITY_DN396_c0_g1~~TRINITY_DN396_c0_g1_i1.p1  ORF type:complete len:263 (+),score=83.16 TRINITY_DN396_c0_g1_i1:19-807(+)
MDPYAQSGYQAQPPAAMGGAPAGPAFEGVKLFIGNLSNATTTDTLGYFFAQFGPVLSAKVVTDPNTGESKRFGFVAYYDQETANRALAPGFHLIDGRQCNISPSTGGKNGGGGGSGPGPNLKRPRMDYPQPGPAPYGAPGGYGPPMGGMAPMGYGGPQPGASGNKIFVAKLGEHMTEQILRDAFSIFGEILPAENNGTKIVTDQDTGKSKGFGFVTFRSSISALRAAGVTEVFLPGNDLPSPVKMSTGSKRSGGGGGAYGQQ